jgi:hypothetical protein
MGLVGGGWLEIGIWHSRFATETSSRTGDHEETHISIPNYRWGRRTVKAHQRSTVKLFPDQRPHGRRRARLIRKDDERLTSCMVPLLSYDIDAG